MNRDVLVTESQFTNLRQGVSSLGMVGPTGECLMTKNISPLGIGIYARDEAARLIRVTPSRLRRWVSGYTYHYSYRATSSRRKRPPVVSMDLPVIEDTIALSFVELMELRVVAALRAKGVSLQQIRKAADVAERHFRTEHPFASRRVYTDSRKVFAAVGDQANEPDVVELSKGGVLQIIAGGILEPFLEEIDFDSHSNLAERWWPLGKTTPVVLDPRVAFGAPTIQGTRLRTSFLAQLASHSAADEIAEAYQLEPDRIEAALMFERQLKAA